MAEQELKKLRDEERKLRGELRTVKEKIRTVEHQVKRDRAVTKLTDVLSTPKPQTAYLVNIGEILNPDWTLEEITDYVKPEYRELFVKIQEKFDLHLASVTYRYESDLMSKPSARMNPL